MAVSAGLKPEVGPRREIHEPVVVIEARHGWRELGLAELWSHRELLYFFTWRDLKVRYKQTVFGAAWAVLQPVLLMLVFSASPIRSSPWRAWFRGPFLPRVWPAHPTAW
jgi:hypothetical protein